MTPTGAIAWEFRQRYRWGWIALGSYVVILAMIKLSIVARGGSIHFSTGESFAFAVVMPITTAFLFFLAIFTFGLTGDIAARQSMYPQRMFTLPVTTNALVALPMLYGTAAIAILWAAFRAFALWPSEMKIPALWPVLMAASFLAWAQALTWMPYPLPGLRVVVTTLWLITSDAIVLMAIELKASEEVMLAILTPQLPLAFLAARYAVSRARHGDVPHWRFAWFESRREREAFPSVARAQLWFEWRQHGWSLPAIVAILLPFQLSMLFVFHQVPSIVFEMLVLILFTPPLMSAFVAATVRKPNLAFTLTRPLTNRALIGAKLTSAFCSTVVAWLLIVIAVPIAVRLSGTTDTVRSVLDWLTSAFGLPRAIALLTLVFLALVASTWKQLVQSLYVGMTGRPWVVKATTFGMIALISILLPAAHWIVTNEGPKRVLWISLPAILISLVFLKTVAAIWIALRRDMLRSVICWNAGVFALYALLAWSIPTLVVRHYVLALIAILAIPLARISAIPLALDWNRHQ